MRAWQLMPEATNDAHTILLNSVNAPFPVHHAHNRKLTLP